MTSSSPRLVSIINKSIFENIYLFILSNQTLKILNQQTKTKKNIFSSGDWFFFQFKCRAKTKMVAADHKIWNQRQRFALAHCRQRVLAGHLDICVKNIVDCDPLPLIGRRLHLAPWVHVLVHAAEFECVPQRARRKVRILTVYYLNLLVVVRLGIYFVCKVTGVSYSSI